MTPQERHDAIQQIASELLKVREQIDALTPEMTFDVDRRAAKSIMTDLTWATENCTVIALHQIGKAMDDAMGMTKDGRVSQQNDNLRNLESQKSPANHRTRGGGKAGK